MFDEQPDGDPHGECAAEIAKLRAVAQAYVSMIETVENRCMAVDGPVTPTHKEITDDELRKVYALAADALGLPRGVPARKIPLPASLVRAALIATDEEGRKRGEMFPQTADEQEKDVLAFRRVIDTLEFYTTGRQLSADGWPSVKDWPALPEGRKQ